MKCSTRMKRFVLILLTCAWAANEARAQDSGNPAAPTPTPGTPRVNAPANAEELVRWAALGRQESDLNAQLKLLSEFEQLHRKRADDAAKADQAAKAKWETDLAQELTDKAAAMKQQVDDLSRQRLALEEAHKLEPAPAEPRFQSAPNPDEAAYLAKVDEKLHSLEQELNALLEEGKNYAVQLTTNRVAEEIPNITLSIQENSRRVRQVQRDQSDLELQKLQYRALRRL